MAFVEAHKLDTWIRDCLDKGGLVEFVVPHGYLFEYDTFGHRGGAVRMTVETHRVIYTLPDKEEVDEDLSSPPAS